MDNSEKENPKMDKSEKGPTGKIQRTNLNKDKSEKEKAENGQF